MRTTYEITPLVGKDLFFFNFLDRVGRARGADPHQHHLAGRAATCRSSQEAPKSSPRSRRREPTPSISGRSPIPNPVKVEENLPAEFPGLGIDRRLLDRKLAKRGRRRPPYYKPATDFPAAFAAKLDDIAARQPCPKTG